MELNLNERELTVEEIIRTAWQIFKKNLPVLLPAIALYIILGFVENTVWHLFFRYDRKANLLGSNLFTVAIGIVGAVVTIFAILIADSTIKGEAVTFKDTIKKALGFWPSSIWANFLALLIVLGLLLLVVVPGIIWIVYYHFVTYAVVLQGKKGKAALNYSKSLIKDYWWKILFVNFVFWLLAAVPYTCITISYKIFYNESSYLTVLDKIPLGLVLFSSFLGSFIFSFIVIANILLFRNLEFLKNIVEPVKMPLTPLDLIPTFGKDKVVAPRYVDPAGG